MIHGSGNKTSIDGSPIFFGGLATETTYPSHLKLLVFTDYIFECEEKLINFNLRCNALPNCQHERDEDNCGKRVLHLAIMHSLTTLVIAEYTTGLEKFLLSVNKFHPCIPHLTPGQVVKKVNFVRLVVNPPVLR